jgi:hypothetical protein
MPTLMLRKGMVLHRSKTRFEMTMVRRASIAWPASIS